MTTPVTTILVPDTDAGARLDTFLASRLHLSRTQAKRLLEAGVVRVNGRTGPSKGATVAAGDRIEVTGFTHPTDATPVPEPDSPLAVVSRGDGWLIVNKPAGVPVHPLRSEERGTLLNAVVARHPEIVGIGEGGLRSGVVHRLDVDTSGVILVALAHARWQQLRDAFTNRTITKRYHAIVHGSLRGERDEAFRLTVAQHRPAKVKVVGEHDTRRESRRCTLRWRSIASAPDATLVEIDLGTGFLHQIRVMLAHLGHPLVGDALYGGTPLGGATRPMLHAHWLECGGIVGEAPPPVDFERVWRELRGDQPPS